VGAVGQSSRGNYQPPKDSTFLKIVGNLARIGTSRPPATVRARVSKGVFITEEEGRTFESTEQKSITASREVPFLIFSVNSVVLPSFSVIKTPLLTRAQPVPGLYVCRAILNYLDPPDAPAKGQTLGGWCKGSRLSAINFNLRPNPAFAQPIALFFGVSRVPHRRVQIDRRTALEIGLPIAATAVRRRRRTDPWQ